MNPPRIKSTSSWDNALLAHSVRGKYARSGPKISTRRFQYATSLCAAACASQWVYRKNRVGSDSSCTRCGTLRIAMAYSIFCNKGIRSKTSCIWCNPCSVITRFRSNDAEKVLWWRKENGGDANCKWGLLGAAAKLLDGLNVAHAVERGGSWWWCWIWYCLVDVWRFWLPDSKRLRRTVPEIPWGIVPAVLVAPAAAVVPAKGGVSCTSELVGTCDRSNGLGA